ncbi:hypothetical protein [Lapillicoccus jejuensis]|uniref:ESAT-6 protein secretion system EspG family protein n=1 Tax=Lapillicoccus jejuensis TaxID=402171 RepID=A0A542E1T4_9MICO|nr:hypothetical protein [Lapillicoccus jejuensis]TQJ09302.1 hypothetical protein FB458_2412 [Lapillicoccus jejuensis]
MTVTADPFAGTDLGLAELPDGMTGFGVAEVGFLLSLHRDEVTAEASRRFVGLDERLVTDELLLLAGASSLTARGLLTVDERAVQARSAAALLEVALGRTVRWTRVALLGEDDTMANVVFFLQTPEVCAIVEPSVTATWWTGFGQAGDDPGALLDALARTRLDQGDAAVIVDVREPDGARRNLLVGREGQGALVATADVGPGGEGGTRVDLEGPDALAEVLRSMVPAVTA